MEKKIKNHTGPSQQALSVDNIPKLLISLIEESQQTKANFLGNFSINQKWKFTNSC